MFVVVPSQHFTGADPGFQVRGSAFKIMATSGARREFFLGVFRVKNHDFTQKKFLSNFRGAPGAPPSGSAPALHTFVCVI